MVDFFFDTANEEYIKKLWNDELKVHIDSSLVRGITTNQNAFSKTKMTKLKDWETQLPKLCETVSEIRRDNKGVVYCQAPNSEMSVDEILRFAEHIRKFHDGNTRLGLKIPPYYKVLKRLDEINAIMDTNVTGVADAGTAIFAASFGPSFVSVIPGRMEEVGIDAKKHVFYVMNSNLRNTEIISGSMRTIEGLAWVIGAGTVPTIGERVWNLMYDENYFDKLRAHNFYTLGLDVRLQDLNIYEGFAPYNEKWNESLSQAFFRDMDIKGNECKTDFDNEKI